jgi:uncharacterized protein YjgD (DUF1641 family)
LQNSGIIDILQAFLSSKATIATIALEQVQRPSMISTINNAMTGMGMVSKIDAKQLGVLTDALVTGLQQVRKRSIRIKNLASYNFLRRFKILM